MGRGDWFESTIDAKQSTLRLKKKGEGTSRLQKRMCHVEKAGILFALLSLNEAVMVQLSKLTVTESAVSKGSVRGL